MKVGFFSDLHTEYMKPASQITPKLRRMGQAYSREDFAADLALAYMHCEVVVAAGDIGAGEKAVAFLRLAFPDKPVLYTPGNHDYWGGEFYATQQEMAAACAGTNVHLLHAGQMLEIAGAMFCGATLWTDFMLSGSPYALETVETLMNDFRKIRVRRNSADHLDKAEVPRRLKPQFLLGQHRQHLSRIKEAMASAREKGKPLVVVSHHLPSAQSLWCDGARPDRQAIGTFEYEKTDVCYASHLDHLFEREDAPQCWIHGHSHVAVDYRIGSTRVVSNPKGYAEGDETGWEIGRHIEVPL